MIQSAVTVSGGIGLTEALARAARPGQKDFKLGGPHGHRTRPSGRRANIQSAVTVTGGNPRDHDQTHPSTGACGPSQSDRLQAGRPPLLLDRAGQRPPDRAVGQDGQIHSLLSLSRESVQGRIGVTKALARAGPASQYTICQCTCTIQGMIWYT